MCLKRIDGLKNVLPTLYHLILQAIRYVPPQCLCVILLSICAPLCRVAYDEVFRVACHPRRVVEEQADQQLLTYTFLRQRWAGSSLRLCFAKLQKLLPLHVSCHAIDSIEAIGNDS